MFGHALRWAFNLFFALFTHRQVEGLEFLPARGPYILAANHLNFFDLPFLYGLLGGPHVAGWAAEKYQRHPLFGPIVRLGGGTFIRRGEVDRSALAWAQDWLARGNVFGMAPEGTRSRTGTLARGKTGAAYLAHLAQVPIVPVGLSGTENLTHSLLRLRRPHLTLRVGAPFRLPPLDEQTRPRALRTQTDEIMCRIAALLPPAYRGVYADHPRLLELLDRPPGADPSPGPPSP
jgi:1-acyl-sn-glycerol-3-phosphate acyltransferase